MNDPASILRGRQIFLSASIPSKERNKRFLKIERAAEWITEAVIDLTRAVLAHGGGLVMGAHPTISPLVAQVAAEYRLPPTVEGERLMPTENPDAGAGYIATPILIYQSRIFESVIPAETLLLERLGCARIAWTDVVGNEKLDLKRRNRPPTPRSIRLMRETLLKDSRPDAMVCIGGMEGVIEEAKLFAETYPDRPIYTFETTGGAASLLSEETALKNVLRPIDSEIFHSVAKSWEEFPIRSENVSEDVERSPQSKPEAPTSAPSPIDIYPLAMQTIVAEVGHDGSSRP